MDDQTTLFYKLKLKRTRTPTEVFEKMSKSVKKKGATKNWVCNYDEKYFAIDFGDEKSETFRISFDEKKVCNEFCKVFFPLSGDEFDDEKKSEFKALLNMIYSARTSFSEMEITDDYGISESFLDTKVNKIALRELTDEEIERARRLFEEGRTEIKEFINALMFDYRELPYSEDFIPYINRRIGQDPIMFWRGNSYLKDFYPSFIDSFLYETTEYKNQGRLYKVHDYYDELNGVFFSVMAFFEGIETVTGYHVFEKGGDPKSTQVLRLYYNKCLPLIEAENDAFGKCVLAYRFFVSSLEYLGFKISRCERREGDFICENLANAVKAMLDGGNHDEYIKAVAEELSRKK